MVKETLLILSLLFRKRKRTHIFEAVPMISILSLLGMGVRIDLWFIVAVVLVSVLNISFGEVLRENVKRNPKLGHRYIQKYRKHVATLKNIRRGSFQEFSKVMETVPLPRRLVKMYLTLVGVYLVTYLCVMYFTLTQ